MATKKELQEQARAAMLLEAEILKTLILSGEDVSQERLLSFLKKGEFHAQKELEVRQDIERPKDVDFF